MSRHETLRIARALCRTGGRRNLTMRRLGLRIGVSATSIYRDFQSKADLIDAVARDTLDELERRLLEIPSTADPERATLAMCHAYLAFAVSERWLYRLVFEEAGVDAPVEAANRVAHALARETSRLVGERGEEAALMLVAVLHGFGSRLLHSGERPGDLHWEVMGRTLEKLVSGFCPARGEQEQRAG